MFQKITNTQKKSIAKYSRRLCDLRTLTTNLTSALDIEAETNVATLKQKLDVLTECYGNTSIVLEQFLTVLKSCPEKELGAEYEAQFDSVLSDSPIVRCYNNSDEWRKLNDKVKTLVALVNKQKTALYKLRNTIPNVIGRTTEQLSVSQNHVDVTSEAKSGIERMKADVEAVLQEYQFTIKNSEITTQHPILKSITSLLTYLNETLGKLADLDQPNDVSMEESVTDKQKLLTNEAEDVIATMLLIIQSVYKKHLPESKHSESTDVLDAINEIIDEKQTDENEESQSKEILEDNHIRELLQEKLSADTKMLQLDALNTKLNSLVVHYVEYIASGLDVNEVKNTVARVVPILEQTVLFVQYFVTQKVSVHRVSCKMLSVLLKIFADLSAKG